MNPWTPLHSANSHIFWQFILHKPSSWLWFPARELKRTINGKNRNHKRKRKQLNDWWRRRRRRSRRTKSWKCCRMRVFLVCLSWRVPQPKEMKSRITNHQTMGEVHPTTMTPIYPQLQVKKRSLRVMWRLADSRYQRPPRKETGCEGGWANK